MTLIIARLGVLAVATGAGVALGPALGLKAASHWLGLAGFCSVAVTLSLLIFVGEAGRDALDPRKTFK